MNPLTKWQGIVGEQNILTSSEHLERYTANVTGIERSIQAVLLPESTEQVQKIVAIANENKTPLYPISSGKNWGLGDRLPVQSGATIVDLKRMNKIHRVDPHHGYAVIEPGVTQKQLYEYLREHNLPFIINITGAGSDTTFVGNAMDRGIGYYGSRVDSMSGLEVVLGNGEVLRTGFGHYLNSKTTYLYPHGVGPSLEGLFFQSNFGIVTKVGMELIPHKDSHAYLSCSLKNPNNLEAFVDILTDLRQRNIVRTTFHISNDHRSEINACPLLYNYFLKEGDDKETSKRKAVELFNSIKSCWSASCGLLGTKSYIKDAYEHTKQALKGIGSVKLWTFSSLKKQQKIAQRLSFLPSYRLKKALLATLEPPLGHSRGIPSNDALNSIFWPLNKIPQDLIEPAQQNCGKLYVLPLVPMSGEAFGEVVQITTNILHDKFGFTPYITMNMAKDKVFESVINIAFHRDDPHQVQKAHNAITEVNRQFVTSGYIPYRVGIQAMSEIISSQDYHWQIVAQLKDILDPNKIISPGRYNLV
ncbi:FAD-binding oxidoreductase [Candidatus Uabimicrobium amorphum]|uniref:4-cresol dehydrogenase n=1 Tax=Uabimicrobium amorphum TaxID=2596890 RepID=A0A5S9IQD9_UABAM|nr:FAD-binding oxidoreductase [Candidatus Uabimicrobium amorphum]BBM85974.1 4-cresol dehydrogenase [Candidatus Uabimicrobium amorphum]